MVISDFVFFLSGRFYVSLSLPIQVGPFYLIWFSLYLCEFYFVTSKTILPRISLYFKLVVNKIPHTFQRIQINIGQIMWCI